MLASGASPLSEATGQSMLSAPIVPDVTSKLYSDTVPVLVIARL